MEKEKATIDDYARMCKFYDDCSICPLGGTTCHLLISENPDKANEIILKWIKEHPIKTRQDKFLEMFPNAKIRSDGVLDFPPCHIDKGEYIETGRLCSAEHGYGSCDECRKNYWLAEVEE